ncbi:MULTISPECIES: DUF4350 domain-containing protein [Streptomyces]|uniref:DUF4350 domain-containing protein n=1 Tax=Streptomyces caniscabiei TaxID=2746961 RepID=A0ABU4N2R3_9ACTN|nr:MULTISPECIES: DUF4350 domain-containing protein [Streptomyces]MBE4740264.1 DUF4350 domain-containing protein [Streptomyces caniscabiei]MBE4759154.1 DUF4350 domain-containing protein [Streptomyces caniscabiei]MBE4773024.1 DUF4350 domain-containing protein [Streptomyces caniscabiei]MBE4788088.1 DUF4350 domain-containing protein [Streptomyces caniscabiei]MBE4797310.1 DUF4350 domain-containing protein [Streptomyces caniscabiei]
MTTGTTLPSTSVSPTARQVWTRARGVVLAAVVLLAAAVVIAVIRSGSEHGRLDPRSADTDGSRAVAELLDDRGVSTRLVTTLDEARAAAGPDTTLLIAVPDLLTDSQQSRLHEATEASGGRTVLVAPGPSSVSTLSPGVTTDAALSLDSTLTPRCELPAARRAGSADTGGLRYHVTARAADTCYPEDGLPTLVHVPAAEGDGDTVVLGAPDILLNSSLDEQGNASLALQLLGSRPHVVWYLPSLSDDSAPDSGNRSFFDLLPSGWFWGTLQLFFAAALAALWRARRLGPLVPEKLPVAIRASETVEGRARLYRKADARDRAADALRSTTRTRLAPLVGVPVSRAHTPEALLPALSAHLHGDGQPLHALLFGPPPGDDKALIALTDQLDALEREVRRS